MCDFWYSTAKFATQLKLHNLWQALQLKQVSRDKSDSMVCLALHTRDALLTANPYSNPRILYDPLIPVKCDPWTKSYKQVQSITKCGWEKNVQIP